MELNREGKEGRRGGIGKKRIGGGQTGKRGVRGCRRG